MGIQRILWATAMGGLRIANAFCFVLLVAFIGSSLGAIEGDALLAAWLVLPVVAIVVFENIWINGLINRRIHARLGGAAGVAVTALLAFQLPREGGFATAVTVLIAFLALLSVAALIRPFPVRYGPLKMVRE